MEVYMPKKLERLVKHLKKKGYKNTDAYAIATSQMNKSKNKVKPFKITKVKVI